MIRDRSVLAEGRRNRLSLGDQALDLLGHARAQGQQRPRPRPNQQQRRERVAAHKPAHPQRNVVVPAPELAAAGRDDPGRFPQRRPVHQEGEAPHDIGMRRRQLKRPVQRHHVFEVIQARDQGAQVVGGERTLEPRPAGLVGLLDPPFGLENGDLGLGPGVGRGLGDTARPAGLRRDGGL